MNVLRVGWLLGIVFLFYPVGIAFAAEVSTKKVATPRGTEIDVVAHLPVGSGRLPAIVIGPGQGYHKDLPIVKELAARAAKTGWVAFRFDWGFFTEKGSPSAGYKNEIEDMGAVMKWVKSHGRVDPKQIVVVGKSLGTIVGYRVFHADPALKACVLLTPVFRNVEEARALYPELEQAGRPVLFLHGAEDPLAKPSVVHDVLKDGSAQVVNVMVPGDHSLNLGPYDDDAWKARNAANLEVSLATTLHWIGTWLDGATAPGAERRTSKEDAARVRRARADLSDLVSACELFRADHGRYPDALDELMEPPALPTGETMRYIKRMANDPWTGEPYIYDLLDDGPVLLSYGADQKEGGTGVNADLSSRDDE